ncbi:MAG: thioredoxin [Solirubrobacterales bacterium]|nr:thioredoxin [Solirubrobacterales bacterium]
MSGSLPEVTDTNFQSEVIDQSGATLVDFWAPWCGPCRVLTPVLEEINGERDDIRVVSLNVDDNQQTAAQYEVMSIPTMILFKDGEMVGKMVGAMPKRKLLDQLEPVLGG